MDLYRLHFSSGTTESHARDAKEPPLILGRGFKKRARCRARGGRWVCAGGFKRTRRGVLILTGVKCQAVRAGAKG